MSQHHHSNTLEPTLTQYSPTKKSPSGNKNDGFVQPLFIAKSQTNNAYAQPDKIYVIQHLVEEYNGPGPNSDLEGAKTYPIAVGAFIDCESAEIYAKRFSFERCGKIGIGQAQWYECGPKDILSYLNERAGNAWKLCLKDGPHKETVWVQEVAWDQNNPPYGRMN